MGVAKTVKTTFTLVKEAQTESQRKARSRRWVWRRLHRRGWKPNLLRRLQPPLWRRIRLHPMSQRQQSCNLWVFLACFAAFSGHFAASLASSLMVTMARASLQSGPLEIDHLQALMAPAN